jgi:hypothetical protein
VTETLPSPDERRRILAACERLSLDYCHFADLGQMQAWSELFAEDAELVVRGVAQVGRAAIHQSVSGSRGAVQSIHSITNLRLEVVGASEARGEVYITAYRAPKTDGAASMVTIAPSVVGRYDDVYRKTAEGWRFARREFVPLIAAG